MRGERERERKEGKASIKVDSACTIVVCLSRWYRIELNIYRNDPALVVSAARSRVNSVVFIVPGVLTAELCHVIASGSVLPPTRPWNTHR